MQEFIRAQAAHYLEQLLPDEAPALRETILNRAVPLELVCGEVLFEQGVSGDSMYLVIRGRLRASVRKNKGMPVTVMEVGRLEVIGEMALFTRQVRTATVTATRDSLVLKLSRDDFDYLSQHWPSFSLKIAQHVIDRLSRSMLGLPPPTASKASLFSLVQMQADIDIERFVLRLEKALEAFGTVLVLTKDRISALLPMRRSDAADTDLFYMQLAEWLAEQEEKYQFVLLHADATELEWTRRCLQLTDQAFLIAQENRQAINTPALLQILNETQAEYDCVALYSTAEPASAGAHQLFGLPVKKHHYLRWERDDDFSRLARFMAGKAVGLVLAGGGARGLAHIGVIRALREAGYPIDYVGGTSIGAIIGGYVAMGMDDAQIYATAEQGFLQEKPLTDYTFPRVSILKGQKLDRLIQNYLNVAHIEDLWLNYFCVSANLTTNETMVHERGELWRAIRASVSLPGVLPPVISERQLLVDGGLVDNLPVDIMASKQVGTVIAVDLSGQARTLEAIVPTAPEHPVGLRKYMNFLNSAEIGPTPGLFELVMRASLISSAQQTERNKAGADLYFNPPLDEFGLLQFRAFKAIVATGYRYAAELLEGESYQA